MKRIFCNIDLFKDAEFDVYQWMQLLMTIQCVQSQLDFVIRSIHRRAKSSLSDASLENIIFLVLRDTFEIYNAQQQ